MSINTIAAGIRESSASLLGEIITWKTEGSSYSAVVSALSDSGLNPEIAKELLPKSAFSRACRSLCDQRVIDKVNEHGTEIVFQFTRKEIESGEWNYSRETFLTLDKETGKITCPVENLQTLAQELLNKCIEVRTANDISKIVQKLFDNEADLFSIRAQGGVYFVPEIHSGFTDKIESFLGKIGGSLSRFPVPKNTRSGDKSVQDAVVTGLSALITDHEAIIDQFGLDTRPETMGKMAEKLKESKIKIEAYSEYLKEKQEYLNECLVAAQTRLRAKVAEIAKERETAPISATPEGGTRAQIFGYSAASVIRCLGKLGWKFQPARNAITAILGEGVVADATIRSQLSTGKTGAAGSVAELTEEQIDKLMELATGS